MQWRQHHSLKFLVRTILAEDWHNCAESPTTQQLVFTHEHWYVHVSTCNNSYHRCKMAVHVLLCSTGASFTSYMTYLMWAGPECWRVTTVYLSGFKNGEEVLKRKCNSTSHICCGLMCNFISGHTCTSGYCALQRTCIICLHLGFVCSLWLFMGFPKVLRFPRSKNMHVR